MSNIPPSFQQPVYGQTGSFSQPPRSSGGMSIWTILGITAAVVMLMVILLCSGLIFLGMRVAVDSKQLRVARDSIGVSEIQVPENWQDIRGAQRNEDASLQLGNRFAETYAMIITEPKSDFAEASTKFPTADGGFSLKDYATWRLCARMLPEVRKRSFDIRPPCPRGWEEFHRSHVSIGLIEMIWEQFLD
jgi:hypothetical protein